MVETITDITNELVEMCRSGVADAIEALGRALDVQVQFEVGEPVPLDTQEFSEGMLNAGLVIVWDDGTTGITFFLPESSGFLPVWCEHPDATGQSKLSTLAQELGMILIPESLGAENFQAGWSASLGEGLARGNAEEGAMMLPIRLLPAEKGEAVAVLIWPLSESGNVLVSETPSETPPSIEEKIEETIEERSRPSPYRLPIYTQNLLRIQVPVTVIIAQKRQLLGKILELGPGALIQFDKSCDDMLDLEVGGKPVAAGEAVKVGEKFGLRIHSIVLPEERFAPIQGE